MVEIPFGNPFNLYLSENFVYARIHKDCWFKVCIKLTQYGYVIDQLHSDLSEEWYGEQYILGEYYNSVFIKPIFIEHISKILGVKRVYE